MYLNFFPGDTKEARRLSIDKQAQQAVEDLEDFVRSVIDGTPSSLQIDDKDHARHLRVALEDGELLAEWFGVREEEDEEQRAQREAVEEVHEALGK